MDLHAISHLSAKELTQFNMQQLSPDQVTSLVSLIGYHQNPDSIEKTKATIKSLSQRDLLEAAGKGLTYFQFGEILNWIRGEPLEYDNKLLALVVGVPYSLFIKVLMSASPQQLYVLKQESVTEPIQHHLTVFVHEITKKLTDQTMLIAKLEKEISEFQLHEIDNKDLKIICSKIEQFANSYRQMLQETNRALLLAWNTNRLDLIENLNIIKDSTQKSLLYFIGHPKDQETPPTGLFLKLEERLATVYGNPKNQNDLEALNDNESTIEAMAKFSLWYLQDYWEVGLLPHISTLSELDLDPRHHSEKERIDYREGLFIQAQAHLEKLGLQTVKDLKNAQIFSKKTLAQYIDKNKNLEE